MEAHMRGTWIDISEQKFSQYDCKARQDHPRGLWKPKLSGSLLAPLHQNLQVGEENHNRAPSWCLCIINYENLFESLVKSQGGWFFVSRLGFLLSQTSLISPDSPRQGPNPVTFKTEGDTCLPHFHGLFENQIYGDQLTKERMPSSWRPQADFSQDFLGSERGQECHS